MEWDKHKAWFVGPKSQNHSFVKELLDFTLQEHIYWRKNFHPEDCLYETLTGWRTPALLSVRDELMEKLRMLTDRMKNSAPFFTPRYLAHMVTEPSIPGYVGYFTGMLYNNNNISEEASPATLTLECEAVKKLCHMVNYPPRGWGHLTTGGSSANLHCLWRARDLRFFPYVVAMASVGAEGALRDALERLVLPGRGSIGDLLENDQLRYLSTEEIYLLLDMVHGSAVEHPSLAKALRHHSPYRLGVMGFMEQARSLLQDRFPRRFRWMVNTAAHYSVEKSLSFLGFGKDDIIAVPLNGAWELDLAALESLTEEVYAGGAAPLALVAIFGSNEMGNTDDFSAITRWLQQRREGRRGDLWLHIDLAWGGYYLSLTQPARMRDRGVMQDYLHMLMSRDRPATEEPLGEEWKELLGQWVRKFIRDTTDIAQADSITLDPHKSGFVPFPTGACLFKNYLVREVAHFSFPEANASQRERPSDELIWDVGLMASYTVEGSRSSNGATACWLSHETIALDYTGMGLLLGRSVMSALLFQHLLRDTTFRYSDNCSMRFVFANDLPMTGISCFTFAIEYAGELVTLKQLNEILLQMYEQLVLFGQGDLYTKRFFLSLSKQHKDRYQEQLDGLLQRAGIRGVLHRQEGDSAEGNPWSDDDEVVFLRNVIFNPFFLTYQCKSDDPAAPRSQRHIVYEYAEFLVHEIGKRTAAVCNKRIKSSDKVKLSGNVLIVDDNLELTGLIKYHLMEDFLQADDRLTICRSLEEARAHLDAHEVNMVISGLDLGPGQERGGVDVLDACAATARCRGAILFTKSDKSVAQPILDAVQGKRPDWTTFYLQHFELLSGTVQFTMNRMSEMVWLVLNAATKG